MPRSHRPYPPEFRQRVIELVRKGRTPEELGRQFEPSAQAIRNWVRQADRDDGRRQDMLTTVEQEELRRLRRENRALREEPASGRRWGVWATPTTIASSRRASSRRSSASCLIGTASELRPTVVVPP